MKSTNEDLVRRGFITKEYIDKFQQCSDEKLLEMINSSKAVDRSVAINILSKKHGDKDSEFTKLLLESLCVEKSLYTKIEICKALEKGSVETASQMVRYLGCIGKNQYSSLPDRVSKKSSYPLARDIVARSLARMNVEILPVLFNVLAISDDVSVSNGNSLGSNEIRISEVLDAIGYMLFYNQEYINGDYFEKIINVMDKYLENDLITWKCVMCLSSFKTQESIDILNQVLKSDKANVIKDEARCSIKKINK